MALAHTHARRLTWLIASLVAFVLSLGLHRSLVVCTGPHCEAVIQWTHSSGECCTRIQSENASSHAGCSHAAGGEHDGEDGDTESIRPAGGCSDAPLLLQTGPTPERVVFVPPIPGLVAVIDWLPTVLPAVPVERAHAPATGPPRPAESLERKATTVLLI